MITTNFKQSIMSDIKRDDIERVTNSSNGMKRLVANITKNYYTINIAEAMQNLTQVGSLLQLAYAGAKGFPCSSEVVEILSKYQTLVKNSHVASTSFVAASLLSLKYHKFALELADTNKFDEAVEQIIETGKLAEEMAGSSQNLIKESQTLCDKSAEALKAVVKNESVANVKKEEVKKAMAELQAQQAKLKVQQKDLSTAVEEEEKKAIKAAQVANTTERQMFAIAMLSAIIPPVGLALSSSFTGPLAFAGLAATSLASGAIASKKSKKSNTDNQDSNNVDSQNIQKLIDQKEQMKNECKEIGKSLAVKKKESELEKDKEKKRKLAIEIAGLEFDLKNKNEELQENSSAVQVAQDILNEKVKKYQDEETKIAQTKAAFQAELRKANADLTEAVSKLANSKLEENNLDAAITSLEVAVKTLGKIKTVFENARVFWIGVQNHCKALANIRSIEAYGEIAESGLQDKFTNEIVNSGLNWLTLSKINLTAALAIEGVNKQVDDIMNNLPSIEEANKLIKPISDSMLTRLKIEKNLLENQTTSNNNNNNNNK